MELEIKFAAFVEQGKIDSQMISLKVENAENTAALSKIVIDRLDVKNRSFAIELLNLRNSEKQQSETIKTL